VLCLGMAREREEKLWLLKTCGKRFCGRLLSVGGFERNGGLEEKLSGKYCACFKDFLRFRLDLDHKIELNTCFDSSS
jgi:hypothetical protein